MSCNLGPPAHQKVRTDNKILEALSGCAEQTLLSNKARLFLMFPEDLGGHSQEGPSSMWDLRDFQVLHRVNEACRGAGFTCQLGQAEFRRPVGILTKIAGLFDKLYKGWPCLTRHNEDLQYRGRLPNHCPCVPSHQNLEGVDAADHFVSASSYTLGERFWSWIVGFFSPAFNRHPSGMATRLLRRFRQLPQVRHRYPTKPRNTATSRLPKQRRCSLLKVSVLTSAVHLLSPCLRPRVRLWPPFGYGNPRWRLLRLTLLPLLWYYISRAYFQRYKVTHTQKFAETPDPLRSREMEGTLC